MNWTAPLGLSESDELFEGDMMYAAYSARALHQSFSFHHN
jgi:hypothetical protein